MTGEFSDGILTLEGYEEGIKIEFTGNFSITDDKTHKLTGDFVMDGGSEGKIQGDWDVTKSE